MQGFRVEAAPRFNRMAKKLPPEVKRALDEEIRRIAENPYKGDRKKGVLRDVFVEKFEAQSARWLLAYRVQPDRQVVQLLAIGQHENFYRDLSRYLSGR
ncbi:type II toxin-antitoxin system RelE/ParE family toxin [Caldinitratiruptor microaerophilus]|uniref:Addiction module toxin RelE n=1 Tax=Caldinitratiruptor microaerophilus TaxID=671077 RepID=A0AA35CIR1_9FIRM|nr:type II toxin-antitoxin system RelE/ParE family toxin [Caldinitratiruptor microaerophilus]BDG59767.1 hypothetical protein caldi_08570 [Caldinitratiruptor microaerophilus]